MDHSQRFICCSCALFSLRTICCSRLAITFVLMFGFDMGATCAQQTSLTMSKADSSAYSLQDLYAYATSAGINFDGDGAHDENGGTIGASSDTLQDPADASVSNPSASASNGALLLADSCVGGAPTVQVALYQEMFADSDVGGTAETGGEYMRAHAWSTWTIDTYPYDTNWVNATLRLRRTGDFLTGGIGDPVQVVMGEVYAGDAHVFFIYDNTYMNWYVYGTGRDLDGTYEIEEEYSGAEFELQICQQSVSSNDEFYIYVRQEGGAGAVVGAGGDYARTIGSIDAAVYAEAYNGTP